MIILGVKSYNMIITEKQKITALSSGKVDKCEYLTGTVNITSWSS